MPMSGPLPPPMVWRTPFPYGAGSRPVSLLETIQTCACRADEQAGFRNRLNERALARHHVYRSSWTPCLQYHHCNPALDRVKERTQVFAQVSHKLCYRLTLEIVSSYPMLCVNLNIYCVRRESVTAHPLCEFMRMRNRDVELTM